MGSHTEKTWDVRPAPPLAGSGEGTREESRRLGADSIWVPVTAAFSLFTLIIYLGHRVHTLDYASDPKPRTSQVVLLIELIVAVPRILENINIVSLWRRNGFERPFLRLHGNDVPTVDVFVTCCGEEDSIVLDTVQAACALDYPWHLFRVIVLDDGNSQSLATTLATRFGSCQNFHYASRKEHISQFSKNANLNFGTKYAAMQPGGQSDFVALLDVDMIPTTDWLRSLLPHLLQNPQVGMASPPQNYYNTPRDDRYSEGTFFIKFHDVMVAMLDRGGNALCTGSGFVARRDAIKSIGGFPTESVADGVLVSWKLKAKGWDTVYVPERVQWGLGPQTIQSYIRQCKKIAPAVTSLMEHAAPPSGKGTSALAQAVKSRLLILLYTMPYWTSTLNMVLVPGVLTLGDFTPSIDEPSHASTNTNLVFALLDFAAQYLHGSTIAALAGGRIDVLGQFSALWIAPHQLLALILPRGGLFKKAKAQRSAEKFVPTNAQSKTEKASSGRNKTRFEQTASALFQNLNLVHVTLFCLCLASAAYWTRIIFDVYTTASIKNGSAAAAPSLSSLILLLPRLLISSIGWPPFLLIWSAYLVNAWTPVSCLLYPPVRPARESLLVPADRPNNNGVRALYPSREARANWFRKRGGWHVFLMVVYHLGVLSAWLWGWE